MAADLPVEVPAEVAPVVVPVSTWTGFYAGLHAGYGWGDRHFDYDNDSFMSFIFEEPGFNYNPDGLVAGGQIGFNWQIGNFVLGAEADASWSGMDDDLFIDSYFGDELDVDVEVTWLASIRGKAGFAFDRFMVYGTGGVAWAGVDTDVRWNGSTDSDSATHTGWVAGLGVEGKLTDMISARLEYLHYEFDDENFNYTNVSSGSFGQADLDVDVVRAGVNVLFTGF